MNTWQITYSSGLQMLLETETPYHALVEQYGPSVDILPVVPSGNEQPEVEIIAPVKKSKKVAKESEDAGEE